MPRRLFALLLVGVFAASSLAQKSPEETVRSMTVADGLQVELFAAEPMFINPTLHGRRSQGPRLGRARRSTTGARTSSRPILRKEGDRIVILEDTNGDGKADKAHRLLPGPGHLRPRSASPSPRTPTGTGYKVFVCQSPDILVFEDKDGDGKADGPPKKFLTGFGGFDHDHGVHGILHRPGRQALLHRRRRGRERPAVDRRQGPQVDSRTTPTAGPGTVWRCDLDGKNLELIAHNFRNNYEACVDQLRRRLALATTTTTATSRRASAT